MESDWQAQVRYGDREVTVPAVSDGTLRLHLAGSTHLALECNEGDGKERAGVVLDRARVEWLRARLKGWLETGSLDETTALETA